MAKKPIYLGDPMKARGRGLRQDATYPERLLWGVLRGGRLAGLKFRRQCPIGPYIADFYCHDAKLVVEIDGRSHDDRAQLDARRTEYLEMQGLRVFRVSNDDVLDDLDAVALGIARAAGVKID